MMTSKRGSSPAGGERLKLHLSIDGNKTGSHIGKDVVVHPDIASDGSALPQQVEKKLSVAYASS